MAPKLIFIHLSYLLLLQLLGSVNLFDGISECDGISVGRTDFTEEVKWRSMQGMVTLDARQVISAIENDPGLANEEYDTFEITFTQVDLEGKLVNLHIF